MSAKYRISPSKAGWVAASRGRCTGHGATPAAAFSDAKKRNDSVKQAAYERRERDACTVLLKQYEAEMADWRRNCGSLSAEITELNAKTNRLGRELASKDQKLCDLSDAGGHGRTPP